MPCPDEDEEIGVRQATGVIGGSLSCVGSLKIVHANKRNLGNLRDLLLSGNGGRGKEGAYPNIKRGFPIMKKDIVIYMEMLGDCCWELYDKREFEGKKQYIQYYQTFPEIQPASVKRISCEDVAYDYDY